MVIPSQAEIFGRCRDLTADSFREEKVQTPNSKEVAKAIAGKHNPLVIGSNPIEGIKREIGRFKIYRTG